jgi:hypothetical protein
MEPEKRESLSEVTWQDLNEPGAYVEIGKEIFTGFPKRLCFRGLTGH